MTMMLIIQWIAADDRRKNINLEYLNVRSACYELVEVPVVGVETEFGFPR